MGIGQDLSLENRLEPDIPHDVNYENVRVEINADDISDSEDFGPVAVDNFLQTKRVNFSDVLFTVDDNNNNQSESDDIDCILPKLRAPEKGKPVSNSLAKLINLS